MVLSILGTDLDVRGLGGEVAEVAEVLLVLRVGAHQL